MEEQEEKKREFIETSNEIEKILRENKGCLRGGGIAERAKKCSFDLFFGIVD